MGKTLLVLILSQVFTNGWWYCTAQQETVMQTPIVIAPLVASLALVCILGGWISENWDRD